MSKTLPPVSPSQSKKPDSKRPSSRALPPIPDPAARLTTDRPISQNDKEIDNTIQKREGLTKKLTHWEPRRVYTDQKWAAVLKTIDVLEAEIVAQDELLLEYEKELLEIVIKSENPTSPRAGIQAPGASSLDGTTERSGKAKSFAATAAAISTAKKLASTKETIRVPKDPELFQTCKFIYYQTRGASVVEVVPMPSKTNGRMPLRKALRKKTLSVSGGVGGHDTPEIIQTTSSMIGAPLIDKPPTAPHDGHNLGPMSSRSMKKSPDGLPVTASMVSSPLASSRDLSPTRRSLVSRGASPRKSVHTNEDDDGDNDDLPPAPTGRSQRTRTPTTGGGGGAELEFGSVFASNRDLASAQSTRSKAEGDDSKPATPALQSARPTSPSLAVDTTAQPRGSIANAEAMTPKSKALMNHRNTSQSEQVMLTKGGIFCPANLKEETFQAILALRSKRLEAEELKLQKQQTIEQLKKREDIFQKLQDVTGYSISAIGQDISTTDGLLAKQQAAQREEDLKYLQSMGLGPDSNAKGSKVGRKTKK